MTKRWCEEVRRMTARIEDFVSRYRKQSGWQGQVHAVSSLTGENTQNLMRAVYENLVQQMLVQYPPEVDVRFREEDARFDNTGTDLEG